jgi:hypothetical protein
VFGSAPTQAGAISVSTSDLTARQTRCGNASPQPVRPPSVSTFTNRVSNVLRGSPANFSFGAPGLSCWR